MKITALIFLLTACNNPGNGSGYEGHKSIPMNHHYLCAKGTKVDSTITYDVNHEPVIRCKDGQGVVTQATREW